MKLQLSALVPLLFCSAVRADTPLIHVQTDRPSYRLGETIWYRVHTKLAAPVMLSLLKPDGAQLGRDVRATPADGLVSGSLYLPRGAEGGAFRLLARTDGGASHIVPLELYDLALPPFELELALLGDIHYPGGPVTASFRASDLRGRPVRGARVEYLASFGQVRIRAASGKTDDRGRALIRFTLPASVRESGHLAAGLRVRGKQAAVARRVTVSASVASVDAFPEGGTWVEGRRQRMGCLVRDLDGRPVAAEGRVLDDFGRTVAALRADPLGIATVVFTREMGRSYAIAIDRPADVDRLFPLPAAGRHPLGVFVEALEDDVTRVEVRGRRGSAWTRVDLLLVGAGRVLCRESVRLGRGKAPSARVEFPRPPFRGLAHIILTSEGKAFVKRPIFLGAMSEVEVTVRPKGHGPLLAGRSVEFEVRTTLRKKPVPADLALSVFQGRSIGMPDLAARSVIEPWLPSGVTVPAEILRDDAESRERLDAFLMVYDAYSYPEGGASLVNDALPAAKEGRRRPGDVPPRPPRSHAERRRAERRTVVVATGFDRLLERAHYTRSARPPREDHAVELRRPPSVLVNPAGIGKKSRRPPQNTGASGSSVDCRRTMFWGERVRTGADGLATVSFRLNDLISDLEWVAQGYAADRPASGRGRASPDPGFRTEFELPTHLRVGDVFDLMLRTEVTDGRDEPLLVEFHAPRCLKPLLRSRLTYRPRKDARLHRFRFEAVAPQTRGELRLLAARGLYQETHRRRLTVVRSGIELLAGESGRAIGLRSFATRIPADAIPGSVEVYGSVAPSAASSAVEGIKKLVRKPTGCFEQWTSKNYLNLVILDGLLERGNDPQILERAFHLAKEGFGRLQTHRDPESGGFSLWPGRDSPSVRCTVIALRQLVLYDRLFRGLGRPELETAVAWLEQEEIPQDQLLYLTLSLHEAGRLWKRSEEVARIKPSTLYEAALLAGCLASWPDDEIPPWIESRRNAVLDVLEAAFWERGSDVPKGSGIMGSTGRQLSVGTLALAAAAFQDGGRPNAATRSLAKLEESEGQFDGTQSTALAVRAIARLSSRAAPRVTAEYTTNSGKVRKLTSGADRAGPLSFRRGSSVEPGDIANVSVRIQSDEPRAYRLGVSYCVADARPNPRAPLRIRNRATPSVEMGSTAKIVVQVASRDRELSSQVVARIGLPGGSTPSYDEMNKLVKRRVFDFWEHRDGYLDLYWPNGLKTGRRFTIPVTARIAGNFRARPSVIYPYYESGKRFFAAPMELKVINTFGSPADLEAGARAARSSQGPRAGRR